MADLPGEGRSVLVVAPFGRDAESVTALLEGEGYSALAFDDLDHAAAAIDEDAGAVLLTEEALAGSVDALQVALTRQPDWSDIPFILLAARPGADRGARIELLRERIPSAATNVVVLERPLGTTSLVSAVAAAMRSRGKQFEIRDRIAELAESEGRLRLATSAARIGTWDLSLPGGELRWDDRCRALFGLPPGAPVTYEDTFLRGLHPDDRDPAHGAVAAALDPAGNGAFDIEYRTIGLEDGVERWIAARGGTIFENGEAVRFIGTVLDISERKRAAAALAASEAALREETRALDTLNRIGQRVAAELDLDTVVQAVVDAGVALTGAAMGAFFYNRVDAGGESYKLFALSGVPRETFADYPMPRNTMLFAPTFAGESLVRSDDIRTDPRYGRNAPHQGMPLGHLDVVSYLALPVVSRSGEVIGSLFFGHPEPARFGDRAERLAQGLAAQAATAIDNARLFEERRRVNETLEEKVAERTAALDAEMANRARIEAALRQSQKMEAVGQLTGGIAHDFNNMLTGIIGSLDIVRRRIEGGRIDDVGRFMDAAAASAQRAAALTARLLAFSRRQSLDPQPVAVNGLVESLEDLLTRTIGEQVALATRLAEGLPAAVADANQLESAILNLAINARDAMPDGGRLTIETGLAEFDAAFVADKPDLAPGRYIMIAVSDTGVGMAPDVLERVFEPFFTTKPIGQGTGLGLSMVYGFARQSNGQVRIHSSEGAGTTVRLYLPAGEAVAEQRAGPRPAAAPAGQGQTVLLVEDDEAVRQLVREVLAELGYAAIEAPEAQAAIAVLAADRAIDLMISDVGLPGMNGRQLAEIARQHRPDLPILFVTGYAENAAIRAGFLGTNMAMIAKPFALDALAVKIGEMLGAH